MENIITKRKEIEKLNAAFHKSLHKLNIEATSGNMDESQIDSAHRKTLTGKTVSLQEDCEQLLLQKKKIHDTLAEYNALLIDLKQNSEKVNKDVANITKQLEKLKTEQSVKVKKREHKLQLAKGQLKVACILTGTIFSNHQSPVIDGCVYDKISKNYSAFQLNLQELDPEQTSEHLFKIIEDTCKLQTCKI